MWNSTPPSSITGSTKAGSTGAVVSYTTILGTTGVAWGGGAGYAYIIYGIVQTTGSLTVAVTPDTSGNYINVACDEFAGANSSPLDVNGGELTGTTSGGITDTITTLTANDLIIGALALGASVTGLGPGSGYTQLGEDEGATIQPYSTEFIIATTATTYNVDWVIDPGSVSWSVVNAALKEAGAATRQRCVGCGIDKKVIGE